MSDDATSMTRDEGHPSRAKRVTFWGSVGVLAVIVGLGVWLVVTPGPAVPAPGSPAADTSAAPVADDTACELDGSNDVVPTTAPEATWGLLGRTFTPTGDAGPARVERDGFRSCFAQTPTGALLAAANQYVMSMTPELVTRVTDEVYAPGPGRDLIAEMQSGYTAEQLADYVEQMPVTQIVGFSFTTYTDQEAALHLAVRREDGMLLSAGFVMQWVDDGWRWWQSPTGGAEVEQLPSLSGFTSWGAS